MIYLGKVMMFHERQSSPEFLKNEFSSPLTFSSHERNWRKNMSNFEKLGVYHTANVYRQMTDKLFFKSFITTQRYHYF